MKSSIFILLLTLLPFTAEAQRSISFDSGKRDMGVLLYNEPRSAEFVMKNTGSRPVTIKDVTVSCGCTAVKWSKEPVAPNSTTVISVSYDAAMLGQFTKQVGIFTDSEPTPVYLTLYGRVVASAPSYSGQYPYKIGDIKLNTLDLTFDNVNLGDSPEQDIELFNDGSSIYSPELMHLPPYLKATAVPEKIAPGHGGKLVVTLNSRRLHSMGLTQTNVYLSRFPGDKVGDDNEIGISSILLPSFDEVSPTQSALLPSLSLSTDTLNLGYFGTKDKLKGTVILRNTGKSELQIRSVQVFNTALNVDVKRRIAPDSEVKMKITVLRRFLKRRSRARLNVLMITNDPRNPKVLIHVRVKNTSVPQL